MTFKKKRIELETLGEYLANVRQSLGFSVEEVAEKVSMKPIFLKHLETGDFTGLPPDVYVMGFLRQLALVYSVEPEVLIEQYKKERSIVQQISKTTNQTPTFRKYFEKVVITPKLLSLGLGGGFVVVTLLYVIWQVLSINSSPSLEIFEPKDRQVITQSSVTVAGKTDPGISVTINDQSVFVDPSGNFKTQLGMGSGPKDLTFVAKNKFDKEVRKTISVVVETPTNTAPQPLLNLEISSVEPIEIEYSVDGAAKVKERLDAGATKKLTGMTKITISTTNAGVTRAVFNGQDLGTMGRVGESLTDIPFTLK